MFKRLLIAIALLFTLTAAAATEPAELVTQRTHAVLDAITSQRAAFKAAVAPKKKAKK